MAKRRLSTRNPSEGAEQFYLTADLWTAITGSETITRVTGANNLTGSTSPIMRIVTTGAAQGAYKDYAVVAGDLVWVTFLSLETTEAVTVEAYDQTNGASIKSQAGSIDSAATIELAFTVPTASGERAGDEKTVRINITTSAAKTVDIDNFAFSINSLIINPDNVVFSPAEAGGIGQGLSGDRIEYDIAVHGRFTLSFHYIPDTMYDRLYTQFKSNDIIFFDSADVPLLTELFTYYDSLTDNFDGITSPAQVADAGVGKTAAQSTMPVLYTGPVGAGATPLTEWSTANYAAAGTDDGNSVATSDPADTFYLFHKYVFSDEAWDRTDVQRLSITVKAESVDGSPAANHGVILYAFIWTALDTPAGWTEIARTTNADKNTLSWSTMDQDRAQSLLTDDQNEAPGTDGPDLFLLLRSRGARDGANSLTLETYYVEFTFNEGMDSEMTLTHQIALPTDTEANDITVANRTTGAAFVHGTNFTVRDGVTLPTNIITFVTGQSQGDEIIATYNRYHECRIAHMPDRALFDAANNDPRRVINVILETVKGT